MASERTVTVTRNWQVRLPSIPNFLCTVDDTAVPIEDVDESVLHQIAAEWADAFVAKAKERRERRPAPEVRE